MLEVQEHRVLCLPKYPDYQGRSGRVRSKIEWKRIKWGKVRWAWIERVGVPKGAGPLEGVTQNVLRGNGWWRNHSSAGDMELLRKTCCGLNKVTQQISIIRLSRVEGQRQGRKRSTFRLWPLAWGQCPDTVVQESLQDGSPNGVTNSANNWQYCHQVGFGRRTLFCRNSAGGSLVKGG